MTLPFDQIACIDYETYFDDEYSLRKMHTTDYVRDNRFCAQSVAIKIVGSDAEPSTVLGHDNVKAAMRAIDWSRTALLAHHTQFDGLITTHHFGVYPAFWLDTMSMARMVFGVDGSVSLAALAAKLGMRGKIKGQALTDVKGLHVEDMTPEQQRMLLEYNADDADQTVQFYELFAKIVPEDELRLIDITMRMYCEPTLLIDGERVQRVHEQEIARKQELFDKIGLDVKELGSAKKFAGHLETLGVDPPRKISVRTGKPTYAFSKGDYEFKSLLTHPDDRVRWLVEARLASKSTLVETRSGSIMNRLGRPTPIYLNYYGARTGRWSGGDGVNWQNLPRRGLGAELRKSLVAPPGHLLIVSDAAQIEARMLAWHAGQDDITAVFRSGGDVYALAASNVYGYTINKIDHPDERFVGKVLTLGAGYGAGAFKINYMLKIGAFGPSVAQLKEETQNLVNAWRAANKYIVRHWRTMFDNLRNAFLNRIEVDDGVVCFEGRQRGGYLHLPNGAYVFYPNVYWDEDESQLKYVAKNGPVKLYGGIVAENVNQALARVQLGEQMIEMDNQMPDARIATTTHDEVALVVPEAKAADYAKNVHSIMSTPSPWAAGLPLDADTEISQIYQKS